MITLETPIIYVNSIQLTTKIERNNNIDIIDNNILSNDDKIAIFLKLYGMNRMYINATTYNTAVTIG